MKGKIVAIGGGGIEKVGKKISTGYIDQRIIKLTGKKSPKGLLLATAKGDSPEVWEIFNKYFGKKLGCKTDFLPLCKKKYSYLKIREKILNSDFIYVCGGNTLRMLKIWRKEGLDKIFIEALRKGIVLSGQSAGAICWFNYGNSDSRRYSSNDPKLIKVRGLGFVPFLFCPHYDVEKNRRSSLKKMVHDGGEIALALGNNAAVEIINGKYKLMKSKKNAQAYLVLKKEGKVLELKLPFEKNMELGKGKSLKSIVNKLQHEKNTN
jgi:dipeptidase E